MASDYFALLRQPRRPWLDPDELKQQYQRLTFELHPDRQKTGADQADFSAVTEAYRVLSNPRLRVLHLLDLEGNATANKSPANIPNDLADLFMASATLVRDIDAHRQKREQTTSALGKSLLHGETVQLKSRTDEMLKRLDGCYDVTLEHLRRVDEKWNEDSLPLTTDLRELADRFGYLDRWISQLREKQFQLAT